MAFFCDRTGVRIVAPGVSKSAGGIVPEHDGSEAHDAAENAAIKALLSARKSAEEIGASPEAKAGAVVAALAVLTPKEEHKAVDQAVKPTIPQKPDIRGGRGQ